MMMQDPFAIKRAGDAVHMSDTDEKLWMDNREEVMKTAMTAKFNQHELFRKALINTGDRKLVEASIDKFWGCGRRLDDPEIIMPKKQIAKKSKNIHGKILESIRRDLKNNG